MFTMNLCDSDPSITTRGVCFLEKRFEDFEVKKTYDMNNYKVKRAFSGDGLEILIDDETQIQESATQFKMERSNFNISQVVRGETQNVKLINVKGKVISIDDIETVGKHPDTKQKRDVIISDETGQIAIVFWREMAHTIEFEVGDVLSIENVYVNKFNHSVHLTCNSQTSINKLNEDIQVGTGQAITKDKANVVTSVEEYIGAYKDFKCVIKCVNCQMETELSEGNKRVQANHGYITKCTTCSTTFLGKASAALNECKFLVCDQWYTARRTVVQTLFHMPSPSVTPPSEEQQILLVSRKYSLRLNISAKKIEDAAGIDDTDDYGEDPESFGPSTFSKKPKID